MKKILFFDDFLVNRQHNIVRRWHEPCWMPEHQFIDDDAVAGASFTSVVPAPDGGFRLYYSAHVGAGTPDEVMGVAMAESGDGVSWKKAVVRPERVKGFPHIVYVGGRQRDICTAYCDPVADSARRYKMTDVNLIKPERCQLLYSPDGLNWTVDSEHPILPRVSDTMLSMLRNHRTGRYQVTLRRFHAERRIFMVESEDLLTWSEPRIVLHPNPLDPPMTQFYGMPQFRYGDMFLGFLHVYQTTYADTRSHKLVGRTQTELAYSYDGLTWNRTHRPFMPLRQSGEYGGGSMYGTAMLECGNELLVYALASIKEHHRFQPGPGDPKPNALLPGRLRLDGFVGLASAAGRGELTTDVLYPRSPELSLNLCAPFGGVRVQLCDPDCRPLPGFTFAECVEMRGDGAALRPRWKEHVDMGDAMKMLDNRQAIQPCHPGWLRIQIELDQAELFSINGDFGVSMLSPAPGQDYL